MIRKSLFALALCLFANACTPGARAGTDVAPAFAGINHWINSAPLDIAQLRGKVVLVEFWTYTCINCIHVIPHVKQWHQTYRDQGLVVVGVHTPEYDEEKVDANVEAAVKRFGIEYAVAQDNDYRTWDAWSNQFWPALYLIDKSSHVVYHHIGEGGYEQTEARIRDLLAAP